MKSFKLVNFRPLLIMALSMCLGIASGYFFIINSKVWAYILCVLFIAMIIFAFIYLKRLKSLKICIVASICFLLIFCVGFSLFTFRINMFNKSDRDGHIYQVEGRIKKDYGNGSFILDKVTLKGVNGGKIKQKISLYVFNENNLDLGDVISFKTKLFDNSVIYEGKLSTYNIYNNIKYNTNISGSEITVIGNSKTLFEKINLWLKNGLSQGLEGNSLAVANALLLGDDSLMNDNLLANFRQAGVAHIFAISGLHIGFLAAFFSFIFDKLKVNRTIKAVVITIIIFMYSGVCGFSSSSLRASIMTSVYLFSKCLGQRYDSISSISFALVLVLLISPVQMFSAGLVLSFGTVMGIVTIMPTLKRFLRFLNDKISSAIALTLSAFLVSFVLLLIFFNQASIFSIIANLILLPIINVIYIILLCSTIISSCLSFAFVMLPIKYILEVIVYLINIIDYEFFIISGISISGFAILYYLALIIFSDLINLKTILKSVISLLLVSAFALITICENNVAYNKTKVYCVSYECSQFSLISKEDESVLIIHDDNYYFSAYYLGKIVEKAGIKELNNLIFISNNSEDEIFSVITKVNNVFEEVRTITIYGEVSSVFKNVISMSYKNTNLLSLYDGESFEVLDNVANYYSNGKVLSIKSNSQTVIFVGNLNGKSVEINNVSFDTSLVICYDFAEQLGQLYNSKKVYSLYDSGVSLKVENIRKHGYKYFIFEK